MLSVDNEILPDPCLYEEEHSVGEALGCER